MLYLLTAATGVLPTVVQKTNGLVVMLPQPYRQYAFTLFAGSPIWRWVAAVATAILVFALLRWIRHLGCLIVKRSKPYQLFEAGQCSQGYPWGQFLINLLQKTYLWVFAIIAFWAAAHWIKLTEPVSDVIRGVTILALAVQVAIWLDRSLTFALARYRDSRPSVDEQKLFATMMGPLRFTGVLILWSAILLVVLERWGVNITALVAGLGVGGIAVALAVQNILGDLFAAFSMVIDKPFVVGDFIIVGDFMGTVETIGLKTTRLRSLGGEQIIFANADLLASRIRNYKRMEERRVVFTVGVTYDTDEGHMAQIPELLKSTIEAQPNTRFDRAHFSRFDDWALTFEVVYFVLSPEYNIYMDIQQTINLTLLKEFNARGVQFAFPTQTIHTALKDAIHPDINDVAPDFPKPRAS
ncbi:MAG: mechanosensitive ion channel family protein [Vampirovibrionales bacterium]|nr:mechanosensitive ion channel family protein [Vampirovibrionales bacterium]